MTPAAIYKAVRDFLVVAVMAFVAYRVYTDGKNAVSAEQLKALQKQIDTESKIAAQWRTETTDANSILAESLSRINSAPVVIHDWVRPPSSCPAAVLPAPTGQTGRDATSGRGVESIPGAPAADPGLRDTAVADWKRQWESRLATWRAEDAQWPQP